MTRTQRTLSWTVAFLVAALGSTAMAQPKPESEVGEAVEGIKGLLHPSTNTTIQILQTPHHAADTDHWGKAAFDVSAVCESAPRLGWFKPKANVACEPGLQLKYCEKPEDCAPGLTCRGMAVLRDPDKKVCAGHSDELVDLVYKLVRSAESKVDLTSLYPYEGRYLTAIGRGLSDAARNGKTLTVRLLYGADQTGAYYFGVYTNPKTYLADLVRALDADLPSDRLTIYAASPLRRLGTLSWNHAKMIGIDGKRAIVTGFNLKESHYLNERPVHDLGIAVDGPAAHAVHDFANGLWKACHDYVYTWSSTTKKLASVGCPAPFNLEKGAAEGDKPYIIGVPRQGSVDDGTAEKRQPSDAVMIAMIRKAATKDRPIKISQQRMTNGPGTWAYPKNSKIMDLIRLELALALVRGVPVHVVVSGTSVDKPPTANGYESEDPNTFISKVRAQLKQHLMGTSDKDLAVLLRAMRAERPASDDTTVRQDPKALVDEDRSLLEQRGLKDIIADYETWQKGLVAVEKDIVAFLEVASEDETEEARDKDRTNRAEARRLRDAIDELVGAAELATKPTPEYIAACKLLTVKTVDFVKRPSTAYRPANHAKLLMVEDQAFYIGSHNMYESDLDEFGYFVDSNAQAKLLNDEYWANLWGYSNEFTPKRTCEE